MTVVVAVVATALCIGPVRGASVLPEQVTHGNASTSEPRLTSDGRLVVFESVATNLVPGDTNGQADVFVTSVADRVTRRLSVYPDGREAPGRARLWSVTGSLVLFAHSTPLLGGTGRLFLADAASGALTAVAPPSDFYAYSASADGTVFAGVRYSCPAVWNRVSGAVVHAFCNSWQAYPPVVSADGSTVVWTTSDWRPDEGVTDSIFAMDVASGETTLVSADRCGRAIPGASTEPAVSADGTFVAFSVTSTVVDCVTSLRGGSQVYVKNRRTGALDLASAGNGLTPGDLYSFDPSISEDGRFVAFSSTSVTVDPLNYFAYQSHPYVRDRLLLTTTRVGDTSYADPFESARNPVLSGDGSTVAFAGLGLVRQIATGNSNTQVFVGANPAPGALPLQAGR